MRSMPDRGRDGLPADLQRELLEYTARLKAIVEHLLQGDRRAPSASMACHDPAARSNDQIQLTEREAQILQLLVTGRTNRQIGAELRLRVGTVRNHLSGAYRKLGVTTRTQAAVRAVELGLSSTGPATMSGTRGWAMVRTRQSLTRASGERRGRMG
jgi:DNA-binding NarL/FixJ family response regulator